MAEESRVKKSLLNARVNLIFYFLTLILSFFSRKIFLDCLGADFVGLTTTLQNLLGFLNLAELGIGSAIGYVLYKPLFEHDQQKINEIISVFGYLYQWIGLIILGAGLILGGFLPLIFPSTSFEMGIIYFAYFSFLTSSLIGYFANYKQTLLGADQKNYVVTAYFQTANIVKTLIQMASAYYTGSYYLWVIIELTFGIIYSIILNWKIRQVYPWLKSEVRQGKQLFKKYPEVMRYTKQLFVHQISSFAQFQTTPFFIYTFVSLKTVAFYGNYTLIVDKLCQLMNTVLGSTSAGVGNMIAEGNRVKTVHVFWEITTLRFIAGGFIFFSLYVLLDPFISLWLGDSYILGQSVLILLLIKVYTQIISGSTGQFIYGYGLFYDTWAPVVQTAIMIVFSIIGGFLWGLNGIIVANIVSIFSIMGIWKPCFLFRKGFQLSIIKYWTKWFLLNFINATSFTISLIILQYLQINANTYKSLLLLACVSSMIYLIINCSLMYLINTHTRSLIKRLLIKST